MTGASGFRLPEGACSQTSDVGPQTLSCIRG